MRITTAQASRMTGIPASAIPQLMKAGELPWGAKLAENKNTTCYIEEGRVKAWMAGEDILKDFIEKLIAKCVEEQKNV